MFDDLRGQIGSVISRLREFSDLRTFANWVFKRGPRGGKIWVNERSGKETRTDPTGKAKGVLSQRGGVADLDKKATKTAKEKPLVLPKPKYKPMVLDVVESPGARKQREKANAEAGFGYWAYAVDRDGNATIHRHNTESDARHTHSQMKVGNNFKTVGSFKKEASLDEVKKAIEGRGWKVKDVHGVTGKASAHPLEEKNDYWGNKAKQPYWRPGANPTVDNVITRHNPDTGLKEVLLIQRGEGTVEGGKWALPGGFHDTKAKKGEAWAPGHETAEQAAMRELAEETGLDASELAKHMRKVGEYETGPEANERRDPRDNKEAWSKSTAFRLHLTPELAKRAVAGTDDAQDAKWVPVHEVGRMNLAFDHGKILKDAGIGDVSLGSIEAKKPSAYEALGIEKQDVQAERKRFKTLGLPKIRAYERRTGRPWIELVLKNMENGVAGVDKTTPYGERWERLVRGNHPGLEKVLGDPNFSHDYGSMHAQDFAKVVAMLHEQGYRPATAKTGERQAASVGRVSDLDPARFRKAFGFTPGKHDFADLLSRLHAFSEAALHRFDWEPFRTRKGTTAARDTDTGRKAYGKKAASLLNRKHRTPRPIEEPGHDRGQAGAPDTASIPASEIPLPLSRRRRAWNQAVALGKAIAAKAASAKAHGKRIGQAAMEKLPEPAQKIVHGALKVSSLKQEAANRVVRAVIKERGLSDEHADKVIGWTSAVDFVAGWAAKMTTLGLIRNVPLGSFGYLLVSTAQNPLATLRTAKQGIGAAIAKVRDEAKEAITDPDHPYPMIFSDVPKEPDSAMKLYASKILDAAHKFGPEGLDAYMACVMAGVDEGLAGEELFKVADYMMSHDRVL